MFQKLIKHGLFLLIFVTLGIQSVWALDLQTAKSSGLIGEQPDGYLGIVVDNPDDATKTLVADVNSKRNAYFIKLSKERKITVDAFAKVFGEKALEKTEPGHYIMLNNRWVLKK